jgi:hypothetical protein
MLSSSFFVRVKIKRLVLRAANKDKLFVYVLLIVHLDIIVKIKTKLMHNLFLVYFVNLYMFRAYPGPLSRVTTVCIQQLVLIILFR